MQTNQFVLKPLKSAATFAAIVLLLVSLAPAPATSNNAQDLTFRLINIERRLDTLQIRVDAVERAFQSQALSNTGSSNASTQTLLELQRQQLSLAEQLVMMQKQMLELKKEIDRQASREIDQKKDMEKKDTEKKDTPKEEVKPKVQSKRP
jgi:tRNA splicing endonuclease